MTGPRTETEIRTAVARLVEPQSLVVEEVAVRRRGRATTVEITLDLADGPGSLDSDRLGDVSREISALLDEIDVLPQAYTLEIGTPGAVRELTSPRLFRRAQGRLVNFRLRTDQGSQTLMARVLRADEEGVSVAPDGTAGTDETERTISYDTVERAVVEVELR